MSLANLHERDRRGLPREPEEKKEEMVDHPKHYNHNKYEAIEVIEDWELDFNCGNAVKYICRHAHKGTPEQDLEKALWYLQRALTNLKEKK